MTETESAIEMAACEAECGTKPKCKNCSFIPFMSFLRYSAKLYTELNGDDSRIRLEVQRVIDLSSTNDLIVYGEGWRPFYDEMSKCEPIRVRAGYRRGWDLLVVASLSRF